MTDERPEGIEDRLRNSLHAYAELVDAPEGGDLPARRTASATPRAGLRGWRGAVLVAAAAAAVVTGSVWFATGDGNEQVASGSAADSARSSAEDASAPPESGAVAAAEAPGDTFAAPLSPEVGVAYPLDLYTHCGVLGTDLGGVWFAADPPLVEGAGNPPPGWGNPYQPGTVTLLSADEAVFADDAGHEIRLRAAEDSARPAPCD